MRRGGLALLLAGALAACGSGDDAPAGGDAAAAADAGGDAPTGSSDIRVIQRSVDGASIDSGVSAVWWASAPPDPYQVVSQSGPCVLTEAGDMSGCDQLCDGVCIDGACQPFPAARSAGRLTVSGGADTVAIDPVDGSYAYYRPSPLFAPGDQVTVAAAGDEVAAFEVSAAAVADLVAPGIDELELVPAEDFTVSWEPADAASWIRLRLESNQHGRFSPTVIECAAADGAGAITVPGSMIERFWDSPGACGECPVQSLVRYRRGPATAGGQPVVLEYQSAISFYPYP